MTSIIDEIKEKFKQKKLPVPVIKDKDSRYHAYKIDGLKVWYIVDKQYPYVALCGCKKLGISERCSTVEYDSLPDYQKILFDDALTRMEELLHKVNTGEIKLNGYGDSLVSDNTWKIERYEYPLPSPHISFADILYKINKKVCTFIDLDPLAANAVTIWIVYTYFIRYFDNMPILILSADDEHHENMSILFTLLLKLSSNAERVSTISRPKFIAWLGLPFTHKYIKASLTS